MDKRLVLVTGATGGIGRTVIPMLEAEGRYRLRSGHRRQDPAEVAGLPDPVYLPIDQYEPVLAACQGVDTIVHLAANAGSRAPFVEEMVPNNIIGPYHLCEAALAAGCRRIIFASTNHVVANWWNLDQQGVSEDVLPRPDSVYGVSKAYGEHLGRHYVENKGLPSYFSLRIGWFLAEDSPILRTNWRSIYQWLSPRDAAHLLTCCIEAPVDLGYQCFNAISDCSRQLLYIDRAKELLGYQPQDNSERFIAEFTGEIPTWLQPTRPGASW